MNVGGFVFPIVVPLGPPPILPHIISLNLYQLIFSRLNGIKELNKLNEIK